MLFMTKAVRGNEHSSLVLTLQGHRMINFLIIGDDM